MRNIWRDALESWAIPSEILSRAEASPWGHHPARFARRARVAVATPDGPTYERVREVLPGGGVLLDVGAGTGAASLPHAGRAKTIIAVDESAVMLAELPPEVTAVEGRWPDIAAEVPEADVVVCAHVVYNVPGLAAFLEALAAHARRRVVVELTDTHPMTWLNPLWKRFHDLDRPDRPRAEDAVAVARDLGYGVRVESLVAPDIPYGSLDDAAATACRRLCLPASRVREVAAAMEELGVWPLEPRTWVTMWWDVGAGRAAEEP